MDATEVSSIRETPFATAIAVATDFSPAGTAAFMHALAIAVASGCGTRLAVLNASDDDAMHVFWDRFPGVRDALIEWGLLDSSAEQRSVFEALDIVVSKVALTDGDPLRLLARHLATHPADLLVLGTEGRTGLPRWLRPSFAERLARQSATMTLFVPESVPGIVDPATGRLRLRRLLLPIDHQPDARAAVRSAVRLAGLLDTPAIELNVLHVGAPDAMPELALPESFCFSSYAETRDGPVARTILTAAREGEADLIIMPTAGHDGILDALRGSVTEQILRDAPCPVLAIPVLD